MKLSECTGPIRRWFDIRHRLHRHHQSTTVVGQQLVATKASSHNYITLMTHKVLISMYMMWISIAHFSVSVPKTSCVRRVSTFYGAPRKQKSPLREKPGHESALKLHLGKKKKLVLVLYKICFAFNGNMAIPKIEAAWPPVQLAA